MPLKQFADAYVDNECSECNSRQNLPCPSNVFSHAVQVMAEYMAQPNINAHVETDAQSLKREETEPAGTGYPGQRRRYRVQSGNELGDDEKRGPIPGKDPLRPTIMSVRVSR